MPRFRGILIGLRATSRTETGSCYRRPNTLIRLLNIFFAVRTPYFTVRSASMNPGHRTHRFSV